MPKNAPAAGRSVQPLRKVLVIAWYFPPMGLSGVQRTLKFVKYLPKFGWSPTVLTVTPTGYFAQDDTLLAELDDPAISIERVGSLDPSRLWKAGETVKMPRESVRRLFSFASDFFFIPDNKVGWKRKAVARASEILGAGGYSLIYATAPPYTDFLIGTALRKKFGLPLVLDYRDSWRDNANKYFPTPLHIWRNAALEKKALRAASAVITANRRVKELLLKRYKFLDYNDVTIIPQGYDPADYRGKSTSSANGRMKVTYAGVFYGGRTPKYFLRSIKQLIERQPEIGNSIDLTFIGAIGDEYVRMARSLGLSDRTTFLGYLSHQECVKELRSSDLLWLTLDNDVESPGKLYEYIGARKPILAMVPDGFVAQASRTIQSLRESGAVEVVNPTDVDGAAAALRRFYEKRKAGSLTVPGEAEAAKYDRTILTDRLSKIFGFLAE